MKEKTSCVFLCIILIFSFICNVNALAYKSGLFGHIFENQLLKWYLLIFSNHF